MISCVLINLCIRDFEIVHVLYLFQILCVRCVKPFMFYCAKFDPPPPLGVVGSVSNVWHCEHLRQIARCCRRFGSLPVMYGLHVYLRQPTRRSHVVATKWIRSLGVRARLCFILLLRQTICRWRRDPQLQ